MARTEAPGLEYAWPPADADFWLRRWRKLGRPPIEVGQGATVVDLVKWFLPNQFPPPERQVARLVGELLRLEKEARKEKADTISDTPVGLSGDAQAPAQSDMKIDTGPDIEEVTQGQAKLL